MSWDIPSLWFRYDKVDEVIPVFKLGNNPHVPGWLNEAFSDHCVIHNIRKPAGFLNSWWNRYVPRHKAGDAERVYREGQKRLAEALAYFGVDHAPRYATYSERNLLEVELWLWRYTNEVPFTQLSGTDRYALLWYDDISEDPVGQARIAFSAAKLNFEDRHARQVAQMRNTLFASPHKDALDQTRVEAAIEFVLQDSPLWPLITARTRPASERVQRGTAH